MEETKVCICCCKRKPNTKEFWEKKYYAEGLRNTCLVCRNMQGIARFYNLDFDDYRKMLENGCNICGDAEARLCVDHDHITGKVRGILCHFCNLGIGHFKENKNLFDSAILYLEKYKNVS